MTNVNFTKCEHETRNAWNSGSIYSVECETSRGAIYRGRVYLNDDGACVASIMRAKDFKSLSRMTKLGAELETKAIAHVKSQRSKINF